MGKHETHETMAGLTTDAMQVLHDDERRRDIFACAVFSISASAATTDAISKVSAMLFSDYSLVLCIGDTTLLGRVHAACTALQAQVPQIGVDEVARTLVLHPQCRILVFQEDTDFERIVAQCERCRASTQQRLVRLVDGSDYASCVTTATVCQALNIPSSDTRLTEILRQLLGLPPRSAASAMTSEVDRRAAVEDEIDGLRNASHTASRHASRDVSPGASHDADLPIELSITPIVASSIPAIADVNHAVYATARRIATADVDIVLVGETGTGKDWLAHYIHDHSGARGPFVAVNCPAIPETLAEAELFGVDAGAYTGATKSRAGRIESAHGGTLYLDEIDSMPLTLQAKLLRVLQDRGVERVGSTVFRQLSFRVIVSTKIPLAKLVEEGKFRSDLYYRLSVVELALPVLRAQPARALELFWRYANQAASQFKLPPDRHANPGVEAQILAHGWSGNIRELRAAAQRYALGFPAIRSGEVDQRNGTLKDMMNQYERALLVATLERCNRNVSRAAKELGVESHVLYYKLKTLCIHIAARDADLSSPHANSQTLSTLRSDERKTKSRAAS